MLFDLAVLIPVHTAISLIAVLAGMVVVAALLHGWSAPGWLGVFLVMAFLTSATGFLFPLNVVLPSHIVGVLALVTLAVVMVARQRAATSWAWERAKIIGLIASQYWLVFVGVAQSFTKIPAIQDLAPTQAEAPFAVVQLIVLIAFIAVGVAAVRRARRRRDGLRGGAAHPPDAAGFAA